MFCKYCGNPQDDDALFCSMCGKKINQVNNQNNPANPDINAFTNTIAQKQINAENSPIIEEISPQLLFEDNTLINTTAQYDEAKAPELTKENFIELWQDTNTSTKLMLLAGAVMIIVLFALLMLTLFFPNVKL